MRGSYGRVVDLDLKHSFLEICISFHRLSISFIMESIRFSMCIDIFDTSWYRCNKLYFIYSKHNSNL